MREVERKVDRETERDREREREREREMLSTVEKRYSAGELGGIWRSSPFFFFFLWRVFGARWVFYLYTLVRERVPAVSSRRGAGVPARHYRRN